LVDPGLDGRIILKLVSRSRIVAWTDLTQNGNRWPAVVNAAMNLLVP